MIPAGVQVYVASTPVDFRKGATGLMALVRDGGADPFLCVGRDYVAEAPLHGVPSIVFKRGLRSALMNCRGTSGRGNVRCPTWRTTTER